MSLRCLTEDPRPFTRHALRRMTFVALLVAALLPAGPAAASNGDEDGRNPPDQAFSGREGPQRESDKAKNHEGFSQGSRGSDGQSDHGDDGDHATPSAQGEHGNLGVHMNQEEINSGALDFEAVRLHGAHLFQTRFNKFDGQGRPTFTSGAPRARVDENYLRVAGPDSSSCWQCHNLPRSGGGGDFNALMHSSAHASDPPTFDSSHNASNHRAGPSIFGAGAVEMLAREMTAELQGIREAAKAEAAAHGPTATAMRPLVTKGVSFGTITARGDGKIDPSNIVGVDWDLIVKPHTHKGTGVSLRGFPVGGSNLHLGMQAVERFGVGKDPDGDGVTDELSIGDVTAMTVWMAALPVPGRVLPHDANRRAAIERGEQLFTQVGCASCHTPAMYLNNRFYTEPSPYNVAVTAKPPFPILTVGDVPKPFSFDLTRQGPGPRPERTPEGRVIVRAFTDNKRHNITDTPLSNKQSEEVFQPPIPTSGPTPPPGSGGNLRGQASASDFYNAPQGDASFLPANVFMSERLWDVGSTAPYGHRGDITTLTGEIQVHGGEAGSSRAAFFGLPAADQACLIDFLNSMQVVPVDAPRVTDRGEDIR